MHFDSYSKLIELSFVHIRWRFGHQVLGFGGFAEGDDFANGSFSRQEHGHAVDTERDAAVGRRAVGKRIEEEAEAFAQLLFCQAERFEKALLNILAVDSNAAGAELVAVQNKIVSFRTYLPWRAFKFFQIFVHNSRERMLCADPSFVGLAPFEQRKPGNPKKFPLCLVNRAKRFAELQAQLSGDQRGGFRAFDFLFGGNRDNQVASFCTASLGKFSDVLSAN